MNATQRVKTIARLKETAKTVNVSDRNLRRNAESWIAEEGLEAAWNDGDEKAFERALQSVKDPVKQIMIVTVFGDRIWAQNIADEHDITLVGVSHASAKKAKASRRKP